MTCLSMTVLVYSAYYYLLSKSFSETTSRKILLSFVLSCAQIIMTQLLLGLSHNLYLPYLIVINVVIAASLLLTGYMKGNDRFLPVLKTDLLCFRQSVAAARDAYTVCLGILAVLAYGWILTASYYLPPRGIDDLVYHLPTIFEYIQSHEIRLLPVELRHHYAFPENAELLFMWPTIFAGNQRMVDSVNIPFVFFSVLTVYALLRHFDISGRDALFASLLYALCPVVMFQAGVNYVDIIVSLFFLLSLYFALLFHSERRITYLFAAGISLGLMLGMKYTAMVLALPIQLLIVPGLFRVRWRHSLGYALLIVAFCGWWYGRNLVLFQDPFYPLNLLGPLLGKPGRGDLLGNIVVNARNWFSQHLVADVGIGTYDGGFGLVFWGGGFSSWIYFAGYSLVRATRTGLARFVVLACLPVGFVLLLSVPEAEVQVTGRLAMFVVPIGLFAFCETMKVLNDRVCVATLKVVCTSLSLLTVTLLFASIKPHYSLGNVIQDRIGLRYPSEFKYVATAERTMRAAHGFVWETLDFLTRGDKAGLYCHIIADPPFFSPAPVYGSNLQNRVAYSHKQAKGVIDAYVCTFYPGFKDIKLDDGTSSYDIVKDRDYLVISHWDYGCLILHRNIFNNPEKQKLLSQYYKSTWPEAVIAAKQIAPLFEENIPVVTSSHIGYGVRYVDMQAHRADRVVMTPRSLEETVAASREIERCYTLGRPLPGYRSTRISRVAYRNDEINIYLNRKL